MATANGTITPPAAQDAATTTTTTSASTSAAKRKREDDDTQRSDDATPAQENTANRQLQTDLLETLQKQDTSPSILNHPIGDASASGPATKKAKLAESTLSETTIASKLIDGAYGNLRTLAMDVSRVADAFTASILSKSIEKDGQAVQRPPVEDLNQRQRIRAFVEMVEDLVEREEEFDVLRRGRAIVKQEVGLANGHLTASEYGQSSGTVLTLFGNAPTPKQLFSSLQTSANAHQNGFLKTELPVEELGLPNGIAATKVMPLDADNSKAKSRTISDVFPAPYSVPPLQPPKAHKRTSTRDTNITWAFKDPVVHRGSRKGEYTTQALTTADWLLYGGVDGIEPTSPGTKRKQRDRALSFGSMQQPTRSKAELETEMVKKEDALFRAAYSSFAPTHDNIKSLVPEETKNLVWWQKIGQKRFIEVFALDPALSGHTIPPSISTLTDTEPAAAEEDFAQVVEEYEEPTLSGAGSAKDKNEPEQVLRNISELLETLASHQRNRNANLPSSAAVSKTPISPGPALSGKPGRPTSPSDDELEAYNALRHEIAYLIMKLPPYAVAKLDGDQLADVGVSRLVTFVRKSTKGTLEEDSVARMAKYTAAATAAGIATLTRPSSSANQHYSATQNRTPAIGQAAHTRQPQAPAYNGNYARTPASAYNRSTSSTSQTYGTPTAQPQRPAYNQIGTNSAQYRPTAPTPNYNQPNSQQYYQSRPPQQPNYSHYGSQYQASTSSTPAQQPRPSGYPSTSTSTPLQQFQRNATIGQHTNSAVYNQNSTVYNRNATASPATTNPATYNTGSTPGTYVQPRPFNAAAQPTASQYLQQLQPDSGRVTPINYPSQPQPGSGRATPSNYSSQSQTPVNGYPQPNQQAIAQAQQKVQVAQAQMVGSGTPQPVQPEQGVQMNGH